MPLHANWWGQYKPPYSNPNSNIDSASYNDLMAKLKSGYSQDHPLEFSKLQWKILIAPNLVADTSYISKLGPQWGNHLHVKPS